MPASSLGCPLMGGIAKPLARSTRFAEPSFRTTVLCAGLARFQEASDVRLELLRTTQERRSQVREPTGPPLGWRRAPDNAGTGLSQVRSEESLCRSAADQPPPACAMGGSRLRPTPWTPGIDSSRRRSSPSQPRTSRDSSCYSCVSSWPIGGERMFTRCKPCPALAACRAGA